MTRRSDPLPPRDLPVSRNPEETPPKAIHLSKHAFGINDTITLRNADGNSYQETWNHGYVTKFTMTAFMRDSIGMQRLDDPALGAVSGSYTESRTGDHAIGEASISNGVTAGWDASW